MKKIQLFVLLFLFIAGAVNAAPVALQQAETVAINFYLQNAGSTTASNISAVLRYKKTETDGTVDFYVFDVTPVNTFVIISGDDRANAVIGYSTTSYFKSNVAGTGIGTWMNSAAAKVHYIVQNNLAATAQTTKKWSAYINGTSITLTTRGTGAGPLLTTNWNQEPYYNALCPYNSSDNLTCVTGCVATTMAQIMKFWNYPNQGTGSYSYNDAPPNYSYDYGVQSANFGSTTYNWSAMPNSLTGPNSSVATLMYQCGVSVGMNYGDDYQGGSGAAVLASEAGGGPSAQNSYKTYFFYNPKTLKGVIQAKYTNAQWITLMETEINQGRPVQYEGYDTSGYGGHTWVCDGYDASGLLHMNWGWGGLDNGYFDISNLNADIYNFDLYDAALIGIEPLSRVSVTVNAISPLICAGSSMQLKAIGPKTATYSWLPATGLSCTNCTTPTAKPSTTTTYVVTADSSGVKGIYSFIVAVATGITSSFSSDVTKACSAPLDVSFTNSSSSALTYVWNFGDGTTSTAQSPTHTYLSYGDYTVSLTSTGPCGVKSSVKTNLINVSDNSPSSNNQSVCHGQTATLQASGPGSISWFSNATGGTPIATGATYNTPALTANTTYYVESDIVSPVMKCTGDSYSNTGGYFYYNNEHAIVFNCYKAQTLVSVDVLATGAGDRTIDIIDSTGNTISTATVNIPDGASTVSLNFDLPVENNLLLECSGNVNLYRNNSGAVYPYYSSDSSVILTNSDVGTAGYYYYFYNWKLQYPSCNSNRVPVVVDVLNSGKAFTTAVSGMVVNFTAPDPNSTSFHWNFGDGDTSNLMNPTHTYSSLSNYMVQLIETNSSCNNTVTKEINLTETGVKDVSSSSSISLMPNPVSNNLQLVINGQSVPGDYQMSIINVLGQVVYTNDIHLNTGNSVSNINVQNIPSGVYFLHLTGANGYNETRKFLKD